MQFSGLVGQLSAYRRALERIPESKGVQRGWDAIGPVALGARFRGKEKVLKMDGDFTSRVLI